MELLSKDKNAKIEHVLKEEIFARQFSSSLDEKEIEQAVLDRI